MLSISIETIQKWIGASVIGCDDLNTKIQGVSIDSRQIEMGTLYIPMLGARVDGHSFIEDVKKRKAAASFWQIDHTPYPEGIPLILVQNTLQAMQDLAKAYLRSIKPIVIGITGSNGKTSCKDMMQSVLSQKYKSQCTQGNRNSEYGLPLTIFELDEDVEVAILEMGLEQPGDITLLCRIAQPKYSVITSIGSAHMEAFGNKEGIARGKLEIMQHTKKGGYFYYHKESTEIDTVLERDGRNKNVTISSFGWNGDICVQGNIEHLEHGISFVPSGFSQPVFIPVMGDFQAINALPVIAIAKELGLSEDQIKQGLAQLQLTQMRSNKRQIGNASILDDTYKSNPESAMVAIDTLMTMNNRPRIAVLADMLDLGPSENQLHIDLGNYALQAGVDRVYTVGDLGKYIAQGATEKGTWFSTRQDLIEQLRKDIQNPCSILVKGSRAMKMDQILVELEGESK